MKHSIVAGLLALSLAFSTTAFAKDLASIDLLSGDYVGVAGIEADQIAASQAYKKITADPTVKADYAKVKNNVEKYTKNAIDLEKDVDLVIVAVPADYSKHEHVMILELKKSIKDVQANIDVELANTDKYEKREIDKDIYYIEKRTNEWLGIVDDKRLVIGSEREVKAVMASKNAGKSAKPLKNNSALYKQYQAADKKNDIWGAFALTAKELKELNAYELPAADGSAGLKANEVESGTIGISFANGMAIDLVAKMKSDASASNGAKAINENVMPLLSDPAMNDMGLGFLAKAVAISAVKSNLKAAIKLSAADFDTIFSLAKEAGSAMIQEQKAAKKSAPKNAAVK